MVKPTDNRLRECFTITPLETGQERICCKYCPDYDKTWQKFNPTIARTHLTEHCPGVDDTLRQVLLDSRQGAKRSHDEGSGHDIKAPSNTPKSKKPKGRYRLSPAYISIHTADTNMDITAPIENGELIIRLSFPTNLKLNFSADKNLEGAALCIDGFMNMRPDDVWTASLFSISSENTPSGPHCQWRLNPDDTSGTFEGGMTRVQYVKMVLKTLVLH